MKRKPSAITNIGIDLDREALSNFQCDYPVQLVNGCAHEFLRQYDYSGTELIYSDPPYLVETRTSRRRYRFEYTKQDHAGLLELLKSLPCKVILSGYPSALYDEFLERILPTGSALSAKPNGGPKNTRGCPTGNDSLYWQP